MCAGGIYTPFLLQRSGIMGSAEIITHYGCTMVIEVDPSREKEDFNFSSGPVAFVSRDGVSDIRDWQLVVSGAVDPRLVNMKKGKKYFSFLLWIMRPRSRGTVADDGTDKPSIDVNLFSDPEDTSSLMDGMKWMYSLTQKLKTTYPSLTPVYPPLSILKENNPKTLETYIEEGVSLTDHYCGACALGTFTNPLDFSIMGYPNIHVADASVFPSISDANTTYPVMVMAEIAADRIGNSF